VAIPKLPNSPIGLITCGYPVDKFPGSRPGRPGVPVKDGSNKVLPKIVEIKVANDPALVYN